MLWLRCLRVGGFLFFDVIVTMSESTWCHGWGVREYVVSWLGCHRVRGVMVGVSEYVASWLGCQRVRDVMVGVS